MTWAPWSNEATSKADRVRVEVFSKIRAISLPSSRLTSLPAYLAVFNASDRASRCRSSWGSKSISFTSLRSRRLYMSLCLSDGSNVVNVAPGRSWRVTLGSCGLPLGLAFD